MCDSTAGNWRHSTLAPPYWYCPQAWGTSLPDVTPLLAGDSSSRHLILCWLVLRPWWRSQYVSPKHKRTLIGLQDVTTQKVVLLVVTAVRTSKPALIHLLGHVTRPVLWVARRRGGGNVNRNIAVVAVSREGREGGWRTVSPRVLDPLLSSDYVHSGLC
jgi:hypothetical protein